MTRYSMATIYNWISIYRKEKRLTAKPGGHRQPVFSQSEHEQVKTMLQEKPDITLMEIRVRLNKKCGSSLFHMGKAKFSFAPRREIMAMRFLVVR